MFEGNDGGVFDDGGGNLLAHSIVAGAGLAIAGAAYAFGAVVGKNSAAKDNKRLMWALAENKKKRLQVFGKEYDYLAELFSDEEEPVTNERKAHANNSKN
jgi:hypothetical protein